MDRAREQQRLKEYEDELAEAEARLADDQRDVDALRGIVAGIRRRLEPHSGAPRIGLARIVETAGRIEPAPRRRVPAFGLKAALKQELGRRGRLTTDEAMEFVVSLPVYANTTPPSRNTVVSRLSDLARDGAAISRERGVYEDLFPNGMPDSQLAPDDGGTVP